MIFVELVELFKKAALDFKFLLVRTLSLVCRLSVYIKLGIALHSQIYFDSNHWLFLPLLKLLFNIKL